MFSNIKNFDDEIITELSSQKYNIEISYPTLLKLRKKGLIPAIDVTLPTSKVARYKYDLEEVMKKIFELKKSKKD